MKKFFSFLAAAAMLFTASCSNDDLGENEGGDALVSFSMNLDGVSSTKADIGKGTLVDQLQYAVFEITKDDAGNVKTQQWLHKYNTMNNVQWPAQVDIRLAKNKSYRVVFWAQDTDCKAYTVTDDMNVTVDYAGINNDETRDAFFGYSDLENVAGSIKQDVTLKRPFAQLNVGVTAEDWQGALNSGVEMTHSTVTVNQVANTINLFNGEIGDNNTSVTYTMATRPNEQLYVDITDDGVENFNEYYYLSMSYLLVEQNNVSADFKFSTAETGGHEISLNIPTVPVTRNHRTNILGQILTGNVTFNVYIDADFDGDNIIDYWNGAMSPVTPTADGIYEIRTGEQLAWVANQISTLSSKDFKNAFNNKTIKLMSDINLNGINWTPINAWHPESGANVTIDGNGHSITGLAVNHKGNSAGFIGTTAVKNWTIKNLTFINPNVKATGNFIGTVIGYQYGNVVMENVDVKGGNIGSTATLGIRIGGLVGFSVVNDGATLNLTNCDVDGAILRGYHNIGGLVGSVLTSGKATMTDCTSKNNQFYTNNVAKAAVAWKDFDCNGYNEGLSTKTNCISENNSYGIFPNSNVELTEDLNAAGKYLQVEEGDITFDGKGFNVTSGSKVHYGYIVKNSDTKLTIKDANITSNGGGVAAADGAQVVFESGKLYVDTESTSGRYLFYLEGAGSTITINGGEFSWDKNDNQKRAYIYAGAGTTVYVNGGTFGKASTRSGYTEGILGTGTVIIKGGTFGFDPSKWVAAGYEATKSGSTWTVTAK